MSNNPMFPDNLQTKFASATQSPATMSGTINKILIMSVIMLISASVVWYQFALGYHDKVNMLTWAGIIIGLIAVIVSSFKPDLSPYTAPIYAFAQGAFIGGISAMFEASYPGIVIQAATWTILTLMSMSVIYKLGWIKATQKFRAVLMTLLVTILIFYIFNIVAFYFFKTIPMYYTSSPVSIAISAVICVVAALFLIIDFDNIESYVNGYFPKYFEWYGALGLMVTLIWLYVEILRLLSKLKDR